MDFIILPYLIRGLFLLYYFAEREMVKIDREQIKQLAAVVASRQITSFHTNTFKKIGTNAKKLQVTFKIIVRLSLNRQVNDFEQRFSPFNVKASNFQNTLLKL